MSLQATTETVTLTVRDRPAQISKLINICILRKLKFLEQYFPHLAQCYKFGTKIQIKNQNIILYLYYNDILILHLFPI